MFFFFFFTIFLNSPFVVRKRNKRHRTSVYHQGEQVTEFSSYAEENPNYDPNLMCFKHTFTCGFRNCANKKSSNCRTCAWVNIVFNMSINNSAKFNHKPEKTSLSKITIVVMCFFTHNWTTNFHRIAQTYVTLICSAERQYICYIKCSETWLFPNTHLNRQISTTTV